MHKLWNKKYRFLFVFLMFFVFSNPLYSQNSNADLSGSTVVISEPGGIPEQVLELFNKFTKQKGDSFSVEGKLSKTQLNTAVDLITNLYVTAAKTGDAHGTVALLIKKGLPEDSLSQGFKDKKYKYTQIGKDASSFMAKAREQMIEKILLEVLSSKKDMHVARSDTGNPKSGMRSDLDQTFFVFRVDPETRAKTRAPDLDEVFLNEFNKKWQKNYGELSLKMLDIVSIKGSARFPDPRYVSFNDFAGKYHSAAADLRTQEGVYISPDAITQQVHKRQYETLMQLQSDGVKTDPDNMPRVWQEYGKNKAGGDPDKISLPDYDFAVREMLGGSPELTPQAGFSAAIANWMMLEHSINGNDFNVKYHLRTMDDSVYVDILMDQGGGMKHKAEYANMTPKQRDLFAKEAMQRLFPDDIKKQKHHKIAMDISAKLRNKHIEAGGGLPEPSSPALAGIEDHKAYEPLLKELNGKAYTPDDNSAMGKIRLQTQVDAAKAYHKQLASEFGIRAAQKTAPSAFEAMKGGSICDEVRPFFEVEGLNWDETRGNIMEGAKLTLLSGIYDLGTVEGLKLMKTLKVNVNASSWDLAKLFVDAQMMPVKAYLAKPKVYNRAIKARVKSLGARARHYALGEFGYKIGEFEVDTAIRKKQKLVWSGEKLFLKMFDDFGTVGSIASIAETYVVSRGDFEQVAIKTLDEIFLAIPIVGQAENLRRGGVEGAVLMGAIYYYPAAGQVLIAYNIGKSVYIMVDTEYFAPQRNNAADAIYRGFAGPETKAYGEPGAPPPIWTEAYEKDFIEKKKRLESTKAWVHLLKNGTYQTSSQQFIDNSLPNALPQAEQELKKARIEFEEIDGLHKKWLEYSHGNHHGGFLSGWGAVPEQVWIKESLLDNKDLKKPVIGFLSSGVVDLRIDYDPKKASAEILKLTVEAKKGETIEDQIRAQAGLFDLNLRKEKYERAQRYLTRMEKTPEMKVRFIRDSLYANIQEKRVNMDDMVEKYFTANDERLYKKLLKEGVIEPLAPSQIPNVPRRRLSDEELKSFMPKYTVPEKVKTLVRERLQQDYERSRRLLAAYKTMEKNRKIEVELKIKKDIIKYQNQGFSLAKDQFKDDETFKKFLNVLRFSHIKRKTPEVKMTFFKTLSNSKEIKEGKSGDVLVEPHQLDLQVNVQLDPSLYNPPYNTYLFELTSGQVSKPPDTIDGVKLLPSTLSQIQSLSKKYSKELEKGERFIAVGSVLCGSINPMKGAAPATLKGLLGYENGVAVSGEVILSQQVQLIEAKPFKVFVDPIKIKVIDAAGFPISDKNCFVQIGEDKATNTSGGYWGTHTFTHYEEELQIQASYKFTEDKVIKGSAILSINDIENWIEPVSPDEIVIQLHVLMPKSVSVRGRIKVNKAPNTVSLSKTASLKSGTLGINKYVGVPGSDPDSDGTFEFQSKRPLLPEEPIKLSAETSGMVKIKVSGKKDSSASIQYSGMKTIKVPANGGDLDIGTITLTGNVKLVTIPHYDQSMPTPYKDYMKKVQKVGLVPKPSIVEKPKDPKFAHCVKGTIPLPGTKVPPGSDVAVEIYSGSDMIVPEVVTLHIKAASDILKKKKIKVEAKIIEPPPRPNKEYTVISQSVEPGTQFKPGLEIYLEIYGRAADMVITVPDLTDMSLVKAAKTLQGLGLKFERDDSSKPAPDLRHEGLIYKQTPGKGKKVKANQTVTAWVYGKEDTGGQVEAVGGNNRPYYVVFSLSIQLPDEKYGKLKSPDKRENESDESYTRRFRAFVNSIPMSRLKIQELPPEKIVLPFHVSGAGLRRYPRSMFLPGGKATAKILTHNLEPKPGQPAKVKGALLLKVLGIYNSKNEVMDNYPKAKETKQLSTLALTNADGTCQMKQKETNITIGPITLGWKPNDLRESWNFWKEFFIAFGKLKCFVATVSYPDQNNPYFVSLRSFRDQVLMQTKAGQQLVRFYYRHGPELAAFVINNDLQQPTRRALDLISRVLQPRSSPGMLKKFLLHAGIETVGTILPELEPVIFGNSKKDKSDLYLNSSLPQSIVVDLLKGEVQ